MKMYVGNLPFTTTQDEIRELFATHGAVREVNVIMDRFTGQPRGFGFVEMDEPEALAAISALDGKEVGGRNLKVSKANPRKENGEGGGRRERW